jgi:hypothetical protein
MNETENRCRRCGRPLAASCEPTVLCPECLGKRPPSSPGSPPRRLGFKLPSWPVLRPFPA